MSASVYDIPVQTIQGENVTLNQYQGKVLLLVNVHRNVDLPHNMKA